MEELEGKTLYIEAVLDSMLDSVFTVSDKGVVESCNATATQMFGCSIENARGTSSSLQATGRWLPELPMPHADARLFSVRSSNM
jgi:nitrogen fixation/metabolism regulation signal transduction histidine kinase